MSKWNSVNDTLPPLGHKVLVYAKSHYMEVKFLIKDSGWYPGGLPICNSTHWMELPEPPCLDSK